MRSLRLRVDLRALKMAPLPTEVFENIASFMDWHDSWCMLSRLIALRYAHKSARRRELRHDRYVRDAFRARRYHHAMRMPFDDHEILLARLHEAVARAHALRLESSLYRHSPYARSKRW